MGSQRRLTIRARLTLLYGALFVATGVLLLAVTYLLAAHVLPVFGVAPPAPPPVPFGGPTVPVVPSPALPAELTALDGQRAEDLRLLLVASGIALLLMTVVAVGSGWLMAGRMLRPVRTMTATARTMSARDLHQRLELGGPRDELTDLADTFDGLLARLEASFRSQRQFVANASHELRTPLTLERTLIEVALADPDATAGELRATCERLLANNQHQERLIEAMLVLARGQQGPWSRRELDLADVAGPLLDAARPTARAGGIQVDAVLDPAITSGDPALLDRLVANLIDNALVHNVPGGRCNVWTGTRDGRPALRVVNTGAAIDRADIDALYQPFRRLDATRTAGRDGLGLGLSIVAAIAISHDAEITTDPGPAGGLDVLITFPAGPADPT
ncbi:sensor histidine kinase [Pseudonocardia sp. TRM90224]|uniref:sensor histidine kinase n=1 Tax=Pseudonocardia sp. TRM90224 TaxID=2812678 RepID=UPI001E3FD4E1|nr:ATP-binding protein [Pseudonocardia sp. TRM90224]